MVQLAVAISMSLLWSGGGTNRFPLATLAEHDLFWAHHRQELTHAHRESLLDQRVVDAIGIPALENESGVLENAQMARDGGGADGESRSDLAGGELTRLEILENLAP